MYALVINLYDWFVTHMYSGLVCAGYPEVMLVQCQVTKVMPTQGAVQKIRKKTSATYIKIQTKPTTHHTETIHMCFIFSHNVKLV